MTEGVTMARLPICLLVLCSAVTGVTVAQTMGSSGDFGTQYSGPQTAEPSGFVVEVSLPCVNGFRVKLHSPRVTRLRIVSANGTRIASRGIQTSQSNYWRNITSNQSLDLGHQYRVLVDANGQEYHTGYGLRAGFPLKTKQFTAVQSWWNGSTSAHAFGIFAAVAILNDCDQPVEKLRRLPTATPTQSPSPTHRLTPAWSITFVSERRQSQFPSWMGILLLVPILWVRWGVR
jgi:hypothetical protein